MYTFTIPNLTQTLSQMIFIVLTAQKLACRQFLIRKTSTGSGCSSCPYRIENSFLKSANVFMQQQIKKQKNQRWSKTTKLKIIWLVHKFGIPHNKVSVYFPVARTTFLRWLNQLKSGNFFGFRKFTRKTHPQKTPAEITALICRLKQDNPSWGYLRISAELSKLGIKRSATTIKKILRKYLHIFPFQIITNRPHQIWQMDITVVKILWFIPAYIFSVIDDYSRAIIGYSVSLKPTENWIIQTLSKIFETTGKPGTIRTDNGGQFISHQFKSFLKNMHINHSRCPARYPLLNGKIERFFQSLKSELLNKVLIISINHLNWLTGEYISYYNFYRSHQGINLEIPIHKLNGIPETTTEPGIIPRKIIRLTFADLLNTYMVDN